jgi:hypothetical protein
MPHLTPEQIAAIAARHEQSWLNSGTTAVSGWSYHVRAVPLSVEERDGLIAKVRELEQCLATIEADGCKWCKDPL